jgi:tRNA dimethylallyltransferase
MSSDKNKTLLVVVGPTAVGKTTMAIQLAQHYQTEIISADSRQFYKELKIGVASPETTDLALVKHHFVGHISIHDYYNASLFEMDAISTINRLFKKHNIVVMTGGSGLYIDAVCKGIDMLPDPTPELRQSLKELYNQQGISALQEMLQQLDNIYYQYVDLKNPSRLLRALEICITSGKPYSSFRNQSLQTRPFKIIYVGLYIERAVLNLRIEQRVKKMLASGLLEEVETLFSFRHLNALNTVGYKELFEWKKGHVSFENACENIETNTRRYAKRQMTWFKKNYDIQWFQPEQWYDIIHAVEFNI